MKKEIRKAIIKCLLRKEFRKVNPFDVFFILHDKNEEWIANQLRSLETALLILQQADLEKYKENIFKRIKKICFINEEYRSIHRLLKLVVIDYRAGLTDNPIYLLSLLVQHAAQMSTSPLSSLKKRQSKAFEKQLEFLSKVPNGNEFFQLVRDHAEKRLS